MLVYVLLLLTLLLLHFERNSSFPPSYAVQHDFSNIPDKGNYTCDEITRWLGSEKHYSNDKKDVLFALLHDKNCLKEPVLFYKDMYFGTLQGGKRSFFIKPDAHAGKEYNCAIKDEYAVALLSNFSINNNFSHFLHSLLRLFCALIDARWIVWDNTQSKFVQKVQYSIWLDEYFKLSPSKEVWLKALGGTIKHLGRGIPAGSCAHTKKLLYGSGCVKLLPPEKWFGYPGCRAGEMLPAFGTLMRQHFHAPGPQELPVMDTHEKKGGPSVRVAFAVRAVGDLTGQRRINNLGEVQAVLRQSQHIRTTTENITFEHFDVAKTVQYMASVHIFVSVHGAGMTNMFFMNPGSAVVEIIPHPLCSCRSPDYFYGEGGYYHGSSIAQNIAHYTYCVPPDDTIWHEKPDFRGNKCSWRHLHAVESIHIDAPRFVSMMRKVERDLVYRGTIQLTKPIINMNPHANG